MRIRYVVSSMIFWWRENRLSLEQECQFLKSRGFGIELWPNIKGHTECRYQKRNFQRLADATEGMLISMFSRTDDPTLEQWDEQIQCAKILNANIVTPLHSFGISQIPEINGCDFSEKIVEIAEQNNVKICVETGNLSILKQLGEKFESIWFCLDTGRVNLDPDHTFKEYVEQLAPRTAHLHITDNYGKMDDHQPPGLNGGISKENWDYLLEALTKYDNDIIGSLEMFPTMPDAMLRQADQFLFDHLNWPNRPQKQLGQAIAYNPA